MLSAQLDVKKLVVNIVIFSSSTMTNTIKITKLFCLLIIRNILT